MLQMRIVARTFQSERLWRRHPHLFFQVRAGSSLGNDESESFLLEMIEGSPDAPIDMNGSVRSVDSPNGLLLCGGLRDARLGDVLFLEGGGSGVVLALEGQGVVIGLLAGATPPVGSSVQQPDSTSRAEGCMIWY